MKNKKFWVVNQLNDGIAEIFIYGDIGTYEKQISSSDFVAELRELEKNNSKINLRINSCGGFVYEGIAIFNAIRNSRCEIIGYIDGIAASMASLIAMACRKVYMSKFARLMTHLPSGGAWGTADELRTVAAELDSIKQVAVEMYKEKTGLSEADVISKLLNGKDNYFSAVPAKQLKLVDDTYDGVPVSLPESSIDVGSMWAAYSSKLQVKLTPPPVAPTDDEMVFVLTTDGCFGVGGNNYSFAKPDDQTDTQSDDHTVIQVDAEDKNTQLQWVTEETNYEDISNELRKVLINQDYSLHGALFFCEYGKYPAGIMRPEIDGVDKRIKSIKQNQLPILRKMSFADLKKERKLNRLRNLAPDVYNEKMMIDDDK